MARDVWLPVAMSMLVPSSYACRSASNVRRHGISCALPPFSCSRTHRRRCCTFTSSTRIASAAPNRANEKHHQRNQRAIPETDQRRHIDAVEQQPHRGRIEHRSSSLFRGVAGAAHRRDRLARDDLARDRWRIDARRCSHDPLCGHCGARAADRANIQLDRLDIQRPRDHRGLR